MYGTILSAIPTLLLAYWTLATGAAVFSLIPSTIAPELRAAVLLSSCRGKTWENKPRSALGPLTDISVPQSWFAHFYAVGAAFNLAVLAALSSMMASMTKGSSLLLPLLGSLLLQLHLTRRLLESVLVMRYPAGACMHAIAYLFGLSYYIVLPLSMLPDSAWQQLPAHLLHEPNWSSIWQSLSAPCSKLAMPAVWLGVAIFLAGNLLQLQSHWILGALQKAGSEPGDPTVGPYRIPMGGAFELVSCPHYLAEILIYAGLLLLLGQANALVWLIFAWVVANLLLAAMPTHKWYLDKFSNYPKHRRALIPYVY